MNSDSDLVGACPRQRRGSKSRGGGTGFLHPRWLLRSTLGIALLLSMQGARAVDVVDPPDPLNSPAWSVMRARFFAGQAIVFDQRVQVSAPANAENPRAVPVTVRSEGLGTVSEIVVIADLNPIQKILSLTPTHAEPGLSFRFKVEQSTPIRAAMRTGDGVWHVGGRWLSASGGGCTAPSLGSAGLWQGHLGEMNARLWQRQGELSERLRLRVIHPMDTGLANGIPAFYIDRITVRDTAGAELAALRLFEPIAENPVLSLDLTSDGGVSIEVRDIQGDQFNAQVKQ